MSLSPKNETQRGRPCAVHFKNSKELMAGMQVMQLLTHGSFEEVVRLLKTRLGIGYTRHSNGLTNQRRHLPWRSRRVEKTWRACCLKAALMRTHACRRPTLANALMAGSLSLVRLLCHHGASLERQCSSINGCYTPLGLVVQERHASALAMTELLLKLGAEPDNWNAFTMGDERASDDDPSIVR